MKVYIAGAITDNPNYREQFLEAERMLKRKGYTVINPVKNDGFTYREYINMGLCELMHCDAIYMLEGYEQSTGALLELNYARSVGLEVIEEEKRVIASIGSVWLDLLTEGKCVVSGYSEDSGYMLTYADGSGGYRSEELFGEYFVDTGKTINIRSVLDELEG